MTDVEPTFDQVPFEAASFADNPEPRCPVILLLDTSGSMQGAPIAELNEGLATLQQELQRDELAAKRVELAVVTFGPVQLAADLPRPLHSRRLRSPPAARRRWARRCSSGWRCWKRANMSTAPTASPITAPG
jgi:hypothetical protein